MVLADRDSIVQPKNAHLDDGVERLQWVDDSIAGTQFDGVVEAKTNQAAFQTKVEAVVKTHFSDMVRIMCPQDAPGDVVEVDLLKADAAHAVPLQDATTQIQRPVVKELSELPSPWALQDAIKMALTALVGESQHLDEAITSEVTVEV